MIGLIGLSIFCGILAVVGAYATRRNIKNRAARRLDAAQPNASGIIDLGNGVYSFEYAGETFGIALSTFLTNHPDLEITTVTDEGRARIVTLRKKPS